MKRILALLSLLTAYSANAQYLMPFAPYYSQCGQDKYVVENIFKHKRNGIFVDIGAHDGISYSNTYFLEKELGWTGVCVEPQEDKFSLLQTNRKCNCIKGCVYQTTGLKNFLKVSGPSEMLSGLLESYDSRHLKRAENEVAQYGGSIEIIRMETFSFNDICKDNDLTHIDFLSIDTEGSESQIIKSIDFESIDISVIAVENNYGECSVRKYLEDKGYVIATTLSADDIYVKTKFHAP